MDCMVSTSQNIIYTHITHLGSGPSCVYRNYIRETLEHVIGPKSSLRLSLAAPAGAPLAHTSHDPRGRAHPRSAQKVR